jgi:hypothetical protein
MEEKKESALMSMLRTQEKNKLLPSKLGFLKEKKDDQLLNIRSFFNF